MALMSDIVNDVLTELRFGSGQDVQIHLQDGIVRNISRLYRTLMMEYVWRDYYSVTSASVDATGQVTSDISSVATRMSGIIAVYHGTDEQPLPVAPVMANPARFKRPALVATAGPKLFTIWPKAEADITIISRIWTEDNFEMDDDVPFYRDLLAVGAAHMLAVKSGVNDDLTRMLEMQYKELVSIYHMAELQDHYQLNTHRGSYPTEWFEYGY